MKLLIDECLHLSLAKLAHDAGFAADHVNYLGLSGTKDRSLIRFVIEKECTFVTNNRDDFLTLYGLESLHAGLIILVPNVTPALQRELLSFALNELRGCDLTNTIVEIDYRHGRPECRPYSFP